MRLNSRLAALILAGGLLLTACSKQAAGVASLPLTNTTTSSTSTSGPTTASSSSTSKSSSSASSSSASTTADSSSSAAGAATELAAFGDTYKWDNGLEVTIAAPTPFTPSEYATVAGAAAYLTFSVTIINNTGATYDPIQFSVYAQSGSKEASEIYDSANGYNGTPSTSILDGRQSAFNVGFGVSDPSDLVLEVRPGYDYNQTYFTTGGIGPVPTVPAAANAAGTDRVKFGESFGWANGLEVNVSAGTAFTPSESAAAAPATAYLGYTVTIVNHTGSVFDPVLLTVHAQSGSKEAEAIYDSASGYNGSPNTGLLDGRQTVFIVGFGVGDPADIVMEVRPSYDYDSAFFTS